MNYLRTEAEGYSWYHKDNEPKMPPLEAVAYAQMAKAFLNRPMAKPTDIVGNYEWHEKFPYEGHILDVPDRGWIDTHKLLDFGCGSGRMISRFKKMFKHVDGADVSTYALQHAIATNPDAKLYVASGMDLGAVPDDYYDLVFSTIAIQHIPVKTIRKNIFRGIYNTLKPGGWMSVQVAFHPTYKAGVWSNDTEHANYDSDFYNAKATNGHADMVINNDDLPTLENDMFEIFGTQPIFEFVNVSEKYGNLDGAYHAPYWAKDWLFVKVQKA